jgi:hypothetical protein
LKSKKLLPITILSLSLIPTTALAEHSTIVTNGVWSMEKHHNFDAQTDTQKSAKDNKRTAVFIDASGKKTIIQPVDLKSTGIEGKSIGSYPIATTATGMEFCGPGCDSYEYVWSNYNQQQTNVNPKKFFIGSAYVSNNTSNNVSLSYKQTDTVTTQWVATVKVAGEVSWGNDLIAKLKASLGIDVSRQWTNSASSETQSTMTISASKQGEIDAYNTGVWSAGDGVWNVYSPGGRSYIGQYSEGGNAVTVQTNKVNYYAYEW